MRKAFQFIGKTALTVIALTVVMVPAFAGPRPPVPTCTVNGIPSVTYSTDRGKTLAQVALPFTHVSYSFGVAALDAPGELIAEYDGTIYRSRDAGCSWQAVGGVEISPLQLTDAPGQRAYGWYDNGTYMVRITPHGVFPLRLPGRAGNVVGVGVDRTDGSHVRIGDSNGAIFDSTDGGDTWAQSSRGPGLDPNRNIPYRVAFDPQNLDHIMVGTSVDGNYFTLDGGTRWDRPQIVGYHGEYNAFNMVISPVDSNVVWMNAILLNYNGRTLRVMLRSTDGGLTYNYALRDSHTIFLQNGPVMAAHPTDTNVLYFTFGSPTFGYGSDIYRYDARTGVTEKFRHPEYDYISAIEFSKQDPSVIYFGTAETSAF